jgi:hypothetical protein
MLNTRRSIRPATVTEVVPSISFRNALAMAEQKIRFMYCNEHWKMPAVRANGDSFSVSTCCDAFKKRVLEALAKH